MRNVAIRKDEKDSYLRLCHEITMKNLQLGEIFFFSSPFF